MLETKTISMSAIDEPATPVRMQMDDALMDELVESIRQNGLLQPIGVKPKGDHYEVIFGHRRLIAHQRLQRTEIDARVYSNGDANTAALMLAENLSREEMSDADVAIFLAELRDEHGFDEAALCKAVRKSADWVADRIRLLDRCPKVFQALQQRQINFGVARELNRCEDHEMRNYFLQQAITAAAPARRVRIWIDEWRAQNFPKQEPATSTAAPVEFPAAQPVTHGCWWCGGDKDPYNIEFAPIHRHCKEAFERQRDNPPEGN